MGTSKKGHDPSRAERKAKKRKLEDAIPDLPGDGEAFDVNSNTNPRKDDRPSKRTKKVKKDANGGPNLPPGDNELDLGQMAQDKNDGSNARSTATKNNEGKSAHAMKEPPDEVETMGNINPVKKSKKERKAARKAREAANGAASHEDGKQPSKSNSEPEVSSAITGPNSEEKNPKETIATGRKIGKPHSEAVQREKLTDSLHSLVICLSLQPQIPLQKHFASVKPKSIRHSTEKDNPQKSKGFAFVEFEGYDHMKTCLKLFHHSLFDDGVSPPRKINVELTVGGGGNTKDRRAKIEGRNQKLNEERVRRIQEEEKAKTTKNEMPIDESSIHPSRRARVPAA